MNWMGQGVESGETSRIRDACPDDAEKLKEIGVRGWETAYSQFVRPENRGAYLSGAFWSIERLRTVLSDPENINLIAETDESPAGFITTERLDDGRYEITRLYVDPEIRSRGIGRDLVRAVFSQVRERGVCEVLVNAFGDNHAGRRFYERLGFLLIEDTFTYVGDQLLSDVWYAIWLDDRPTLCDFDRT